MRELILAICLAFNFIPAWACEPPPVNTDGIMIHETAVAKPEPTYNEADAEALAKMLYGEARGCTYEDKRNCCITACNRADDERFPDTVYECIIQPCQYYGYSAGNPVDAELYDIAVSVLKDWQLLKWGEVVEWNDYLYFTGDGIRNYFR